ncbi:MAG TPA: 50S ribosomal protein L21 [Gaiellaceae bacterium]|nr:50S ribosomal protein L21 [Gaiellaceae bacterium]
MTYAIISLGGKQYRVREGERLLVDRLPEEEGATITPPVLLLAGEGEPALAPGEGAVTATVVRRVKGPKIRIGKYRRRTGYRRHTGFRAALTEIRIDAIAAGRRRAAAKGTASAKAPGGAREAAPAAGALPAGYEELTVAELKKAAASWSADELAAALAYEREHGARKGALATLEAEIARKEGET